MEQSVLTNQYDFTATQNSLACRVTSGCENTLFQYIQFDQSEGVYICPTQQDLLRVNSSLNSQVLNNFQKACMEIRKVLHGSGEQVMLSNILKLCYLTYN